jgi:chitin disaccharide deacetylase
VKVIITADDFGISPVVNTAIAQSIRLGIVDSATALANAPFFTDACEMAIENKFDDRIGVHFNLTKGRALSPMMAGTPSFCRNSGEFTYWRNTRMYLTRRETQAVADECEMQIRRCHDAGLHPTRLDSHHHVHTEWFIFRAIAPVIKKHGITSVRISKNIGRSSFARHAYKTIFNGYLKRRRIDATEYFGDYREVIDHEEAFAAAGPDAVIEAMTHPSFNSEGMLIDGRSGDPLDLTICLLKARISELTMRSAIP